MSLLIWLIAAGWLHMLGEIGGELPQRRVVPTRRSEQQAGLVWIMENSEVRLTALAGGLIDVDGANLGRAFLVACLGTDALWPQENAPASAYPNDTAQCPPTAFPPRGRRRRIRRGSPDQEFIERPFRGGEATGRSRHIGGIHDQHTRHELIDRQLSAPASWRQHIPRQTPAGIERLAIADDLLTAQ